MDQWVSRFMKRPRHFVLSIWGEMRRGMYVMPGFSLFCFLQIRNLNRKCSVWHVCDRKCEELGSSFPVKIMCRDLTIVFFSHLISIYL
jgi:hypothetical protein